MSSVSGAVVVFVLSVLGVYDVCELCLRLFVCVFVSVFVVFMLCVLRFVWCVCLCFVSKLFVRFGVCIFLHLCVLYCYLF